MYMYMYQCIKDNMYAHAYVNVNDSMYGCVIPTEVEDCFWHDMHCGNIFRLKIRLSKKRHVPFQC